MPDLTHEHALEITTCLLCLLAVVALGHWLDTRARRCLDADMQATEDAADALVQAYGLSIRTPDPEPGTEPMTVLDFYPPDEKPHPGETTRDHLARLARLRAARAATQRPPVDPFKLHTHRAHVLFPEDEPGARKPPRPWHIGDNPEAPSK